MAHTPYQAQRLSFGLTGHNTGVLNVVVFTGGRGSSVLSPRLFNRANVQLTLAINGYDDGASTGEVRRFLGDALGPSDFRKNAARIAAAGSTASVALTTLIETRLPEGISEADALRALDALANRETTGSLAGVALTPPERDAIGARVSAFLSAYRSRARAFAFGDCSVGNLVFAGSYLLCGENFNETIDDFCAVLGLAPGIIENVTDGTNAHLIALTADGQVLGTEAAIVDSRQANRVVDLFLVHQPLTAEECARLASRGPEAVRDYARAHEPALKANRRLTGAIDRADVIVYAPGTQHSSLFPSYLTPGLVDHIAGNLRALKLLITNLHVDAEITGASAVSLVDRALFYLTQRGQRQDPVPSLVTHYLLNDPQTMPSEAPYVPLGLVDTLEDPRLVRIGFFEDGVTGRHDAVKVLQPFIDSLLAPPRRPRVSVLMYGTTSANKLAQTLVEMVRGGVDASGAEITVFTPGRSTLSEAFLAQLPFAVKTFDDDPQAERALREDVATSPNTYVVLFESSGMYRGDDLVGLLRYLTGGRLDAVWGSRRLSVRDIEASYHSDDGRHPLLRVISRGGSHILSLAYLVLYGRHVADTLSGVRVVRGADVAATTVSLTHKLVNQYLLVSLMRRRADVLEVPVQFISLSPKRVKRTGILDGLRSLAIIVGGRLRPSGSAVVQAQVQ